MLNEGSNKAGRQLLEEMVEFHESTYTCNSLWSSWFITKTL